LSYEVLLALSLRAMAQLIFYLMVISLV